MFGPSQQARVTKQPIEVEITMRLGNVIKGEVYVKSGERIVDLLNDERHFIPITVGDDELQLVKKEAIEAISHKEAEAKPPPPPVMGFLGSMTKEEAVQILNLGLTYEKADILRAHRGLITKVHPDTGGSDYLAIKVNGARDILLQSL